MRKSCLFFIFFTFLMLAGISQADITRIDELKKAINLDPNDFVSHFSLGKAYKTLGLYDDAIKEFREVLRIEPDEIEAYFRLGLIYDSFMDGENALLYTLKAEKLAEEQNALHWLADAQKSKRILIKRYELDPENYNQGDGYSF